MKKKAVILTALLATAGTAFAAGGIYYSSGKVSVKETKAGTCFAAHEGAAVRVTAAAGVSVRGSEGSEFCLDENGTGINVKKGRVWVKAFENKVNIKVPGFEMRDATGVFSADAGSKDIVVLNGMAFIHEKKKPAKPVTQGHSASLSGVSGRLIDAQQGAWYRDNMELDREKTVFVFEQGEYLVSAARQAVEAGIARRYFMDAKYEIPQDTEDYIEVRLKAEKTGTGTDVTGKITEKMTGKIIGVIEKDTGERKKQDTVNMSFLKAGRKAAAIIEKYSEEKAAKTGSIIVISEIPSEGAPEAIENLLSGIQGLKISEKRIFHKNKVVFTVEYPGTGYEIANILSDKQINNSPINVWKKSRNIVKFK